MEGLLPNLMENNLMLAGKHRFDKHPLEKGYKDIAGQNPNASHLNLVGKHLGQLENMMVSGSKEGLSIKQQQKDLMMRAMMQNQLREKYNELKTMGQEEILKKA